MFRNLSLLFPVLENVPGSEGADDGSPEARGHYGVGFALSLRWEVLRRPLCSWGPGGGAHACPQPVGEPGITSPRQWEGFLLAAKLPTVTKNDA